ncbi:hypothetical protein FRAAL3698 [Frankia alni ACN14a]|uniref:Uncharacterized protein n=1 Tax=Frankia alni (strain DSM 45986 / CECT 9034 / ACN14a) TaxID=326424 RepID=Q0RJH1_FRAAA|nr:hypothetical protein FRAAL3698 [Frankia alni ACN14a]
MRPVRGVPCRYQPPPGLPGPRGGPRESEKAFGGRRAHLVSWETAISGPLAAGCRQADYPGCTVGDQCTT